MLYKVNPFLPVTFSTENPVVKAAGFSAFSLSLVMTCADLEIGPNVRWITVQDIRLFY